MLTQAEIYASDLKQYREDLIQYQGELCGYEDLELAIELTEKKLTQEQNERHQYQDQIASEIIRLIEVEDADFWTAFDGVILDAELSEEEVEEIKYGFQCGSY